MSIRILGEEGVVVVAVRRLLSAVLGLSLGLGLALGASAAAAAEDWALAGTGRTGDTFELDVASLARNGDVVQGSLRQRRVAPERDRASGKLIATSITQAVFDCKNHRWNTGAYKGFDRAGRQVAAGAAGGPWQDAGPGTVADMVSHTACRATGAFADDAYLKDINAGEWLPLGLGGGGAYRISLKLDQVVKVDDGALVLSRSDYLAPDWLDGVAVTHMVTATAVDCKGAATAVLGDDLYVGSGVRVGAYRVAKKDVAFEPIKPGSFLQNSLKSICAAAVAPKETKAGDDQGYGTGTAWGVAKGYLVTASHVIEGGGEIDVYANGEPVGTASVVADDPVNDVAILRFEPQKGARRKIVALAIAARPAVLGRPVFTLGYPAPDTMGAQVKMTAGQVSSVSGVHDDARFLQISIPIQPGNSGGPVIGWDGQVVGVVDSKLKKIQGEEMPPENVNYALKAAYIRALLDGLPDLGNYAVLKPGLGHDALIAEAQRAVFMLLVSPAGE